MNILINGEKKGLPEGFTVLQLLEELKLEPSMVAVEKNREILPKSRYYEPLKDGDVLEIVTYVGGG